MFEESVASPTTRPPDLLARLTGPVVGLGITVALTVVICLDAVNLAHGGVNRMRPTSRGYMFSVATYAAAEVLGVRGTLAIGGVLAAIQIVLIARAIREPK
jgi:hypothetical protein